MVANDTFKIIYIGSRSDKKHTMFVNAEQTIGDFKKQLYSEFHGLEFDVDIDGSEANYTDKHNIQLYKSGKVLEGGRTFGSYGVEKSDIPFELTLKYTLDSAGKRVSLTEPH